MGFDPRFLDEERVAVVFDVTLPLSRDAARDTSLLPACFIILREVLFFLSFLKIFLVSTTSSWKYLCCKTFDIVSILCNGLG